MENLQVKNIRRMGFYFIMFLTMLCISLSAYGQEGRLSPTGLPAAPGWRFDRELSTLKRNPEFGKIVYKYTEMGLEDEEYNHQKIINSWGYGARNVDEIKDLLPEPLYQMVKHPEIWGEIRINETPDSPEKPSPAWNAYKEATAKYKGRSSLDKNDWLQNYTAGCPFPDIDFEKDPKAAIKLAWNHDRRIWFDDREAPHIGQIVDKHGNVSESCGYEFRLMFDGRLLVDPKPLITPNPRRLRYALSFPYVDPYNLRGIVTVIHRYMDDKDDDMWVYLPSLRRVRRFSTAQTQDPISAGNDTVWDLFATFAGNIRKLNWQYLGLKTMLIPLKASNIWQVNEGKKPTIGGVDQYYQRRKVHVLKGTYKIPIILKDVYIYIDPETWKSCYGVATDIKGKDYKFVYYSYGRNKTGFPNEKLMTHCDLQRYHVTPTVTSGSNSTGFDPRLTEMDFCVRKFGGAR